MQIALRGCSAALKLPSGAQELREAERRDGFVFAAQVKKLAEWRLLQRQAFAGRAEVPNQLLSMFVHRVPQEVCVTQGDGELT
jgi:hypothetical protein